MNHFKRSAKHPATRKNYKYVTHRNGKTVVHTNRTDLELESIKETLESIEQKGISDKELGRIRRGRPNKPGKVVSGRTLNRRTGPKGSIAIVSDDAVDRITADMEKRTRVAIAKIGRSTGF